MSFLGDFNIGRVERFFDLGWSFIPLRGATDPDRAKVPAVAAWQVYQRRLPTERDVERWRGAQAFGIVLGRVSALMVLDIDDPQRAEDFVRECPDLAQTLTVRSGMRGLPHYYFALPPGLSGRGYSAGGVELRGDGQYVVAPGTCVGEHRWTITHDVAPRSLTRDDLSRILRFIRPLAPETPENCSERPSTSNKPISTIKPGGLIRRYQTLALVHGRNNALFRVACSARDQGMTRIQVEALLVGPHIAQPGLRPEVPQRRAAEARATIASAFRRAPRPLVEQVRPVQLPNAVRERLLQNGQVQLARVLDGLYVAGCEPGQTITAAAAYEKVAAFGIGRNAVYAALRSDIFAAPSPRTPQPPGANAASGCTGQDNQCLIVRVAKPVKKRGRPERCFVMPSLDALCQELGVENLGGDTLAAADLRSPAKYRQALHVGLFKRAPGTYSRDWLASRLGVSADSCRRYERRAGVQVDPTFVDESISWSTLKWTLPPDPMPGQFIQAADGRRYPPLEPIARMLLMVGQNPVFRTQSVNHYRMPPVAESGVRERCASTHDTDAASQPAGGLVGRSAPVPRNHGDKPETAAGARPSLIDQVRTVKQLAQEQDFGTAAVDRVAVAVYEALRQLNPQRSLTRKRCLELVQQYGARLVDRGLGELRRRRNIRNPAGFLMVWLRSTNVAGQNN